MSVAAPPRSPEQRRTIGDLVHLGLRALSLIVTLAAFGVLWGRGQSEMIPLGLAGLALGPALIALFFRGQERRFLLTLFLVAFAVRVAIAVAAHPMLVTISKNKQGEITGTWVGFLFEDDRAYHKVAWGLAKLWLGLEEGIDPSDKYLLKFYTYAVGGLYYVIYALGGVGNVRDFEPDVMGSTLVMAPKLLNCLLGALAIAPFYGLGRLLGGWRVGQFAALGAAFWPSLVLWSIINLKDIMVVVLIAALMFLALRFAQRPDLPVPGRERRRPGASDALGAGGRWSGLLVLAGLLVVLATLESLRLYVFYAFGWLVPIAFFLVNRDPWRERLKTGAVLVASIMVVMLVMNQNTQWFGLRYVTDKRLEAIDSSRVFGSDTAESGIDLPDRISRYEGGWSIQLRNIPIVMPYVLFSPFPWRAHRLKDVTLVPETLGWYLLEALSVVALVALGRSRWRDLFMPVAFAGGLAVVFAMIEGNVGTIYRHRAMLFPSAFTVGGLGAVWVYSWWQSRRAAPARATAAGAVV
ncbi:MAG: glycosyltransferase family 39 protein [Chloroflexi bacterium]|nr:glycosyltransferase family 39 protein [Chloroflexota bacterium]